MDSIKLDQLDLTFSLYIYVDIIFSDHYFVITK